MVQLLDGLVDCEDPECCEQDVCSGKQLCTSVPDPKDILRNMTQNRSRNGGHHSSFWNRVKFLVSENDGIQRYVVTSALHER